MRPFGHAADLDLDFEQPDRPALVTMLLASCGESGDAAFWWSRPVGARTATLLRLVALTERRTGVSLTGRCAAAGCDAPFEFTLPLLALAAREVDVEPVPVRVDADRTLSLRRPTGDDLRRWRDAQPASRAEAVGVMLDSLVIAGDIRPEDEAVVSASISEIDPLVNFAVSCPCPACGASNDVAIDLEALALDRLAGRQRALVRDVHRFASAYGWTEADVLAIPASRRAEYLRLIEEDR
ncbi:MAG TPA: hypothetical protein VKE51_22445 [Vicinamibacterales bacterium]|nr:hypothetical protein [Vicinamibacterales bacterium]